MRACEDASWILPRFSWFGNFHDQSYVDSCRPWLLLWGHYIITVSWPLDGLCQMRCLSDTFSGGGASGHGGGSAMWRQNMKSLRDFYFPGVEMAVFLSNLEENGTPTGPAWRRFWNIFMMKLAWNLDPLMVRLDHEQSEEEVAKYRIQ